MRALARGARAFADAIEIELDRDDLEDPSVTPQPGTPESMLAVLEAVALINDGQDRGVSQSEMSSIARDAGMDPRGTAGYYAPDAGLLESRADGRWITEVGRTRMQQLRDQLDRSRSPAPRPFGDLEEEFREACDAAIPQCEALGYHPRVWIAMADRYGPAEAARQLVVKSEIQSGFDRLVKAKRPDLTIEWAILNPSWDPLFSDQHREAARWRLMQAGITPPRSTGSLQTAS